MSSTDESDFSGSWPITDDGIRDVFAAMLTDGSWGRYHGPHCQSLTAALSDYHRLEHVILCSSGTSAVELALRSIPVEPADEVILAAYDFKANFVNILTVGATPVLVDTLRGFPVMDFDQLRAACTDRTKAIIVSHLHGALTRMKELCDFAASRGIRVIEDACQCPGAAIDGRRAGCWGDVGVLSFGGSKLLTAGRGGALMTANSAIAQRIRLYTQRGNEAYPLSEMQAAVLLPQLRLLDARNQMRRQCVDWLGHELSGPGGLSLAMYPTCQNCHGDEHVFYKAAILAPESYTETHRETLCRESRKAEIPLDPGFPALHLIHSRRRFRTAGELPNATDLHARLMTLHHTLLQATSQQLTVKMNLLRQIAERIRTE